MSFKSRIKYSLNIFIFIILSSLTLLATFNIYLTQTPIVLHETTTIKFIANENMIFDPVIIHASGTELIFNTKYFRDDKDKLTSGICGSVSYKEKEANNFICYQNGVPSNNNISTIKIFSHSIPKSMMCTDTLSIYMIDRQRKIMFVKSYKYHKFWHDLDSNFMNKILNMHGSLTYYFLC